jgi:hypothetical protein
MSFDNILIEIFASMTNTFVSRIDGNTHCGSVLSNEFASAPGKHQRLQAPRRQRREKPQGRATGGNYVEFR